MVAETDQRGAHSMTIHTIIQEIEQAREKAEHLHNRFCTLCQTFYCGHITGTDAEALCRICADLGRLATDLRHLQEEAPAALFRVG